MKNKQIMLISGTSRGIGKYLVHYYSKKGYAIIGCSRKQIDYQVKGDYNHFCLDVSDEKKVKEMFAFIRKKYGKLDILINNAGIGSMNHSLLTPIKTVHKILETNVIGTFLMSREAAKLMKKNDFGRIVNFVSISILLKLEGEAIYTASKAAILSLTQIMSREFVEYGITVNAVGPSIVQTDLTKGVPKKKIEKILMRQGIHKSATPQEICNVIDFFIKNENDMVTGQVVYLGGV